uniref:Uncharacterized protein n=1 Tax=Bos indicus x Bos taurus TaxID=30522 RepID=A0A4W2CDI7_BOBOX
MNKVPLCVYIIFYLYIHLPITPVFSKTPTPALLGPSTLVPEVGNVPSLLNLVPATPVPFRQLFNNLGQPFMGYVWAMKPAVSHSADVGKQIWPACIGSKMTQLCPTFVTYGILQARILEWVAFPFSRGSSQFRDRTQVSCIAGRLFTS